MTAISLLLMMTAPVFAEPVIGISFPPVSNQKQRDFTKQALLPIGVRHIRFAENWRIRQPRADRPANFAPLQKRIADLKTAGFHVLLTVQSDAPPWACEKPQNPCQIAENAPFEIYVSELLTAVGKDLDAIQFGNEWDQKYPGTAADYLRSYQRFANTVRQQRPNLTLVLGGITGTAPYFLSICEHGLELDLPQRKLTRPTDLNARLKQDFCINNRARNQLTLTDVQNVLAQADYDIADIHLYDAPELWRQAVSFMHSISKGPVWVTEFGGPNPEIELRDPKYQAEMLAQYMGVITTLPLRRAYYFRLLDNRTSYHDRSGLFDRRGRPKPALAVFQAALDAR